MDKLNPIFFACHQTFIVKMHGFFFSPQELEGLADPMKKELSLVRKKVDSVNKELKPLGQTCQKKVII